MIKTCYKVAITSITFAVAKAKDGTQFQEVMGDSICLDTIHIPASYLSERMQDIVTEYCTEYLQDYIVSNHKDDENG